MQTPPLPDDPQALKTLIGELVGELERRDSALDAKHHTITAMEQRIAHLELQIAVLHRARFGRRSEKLDQQISQLELMLEELQSTQAGAVADRPPKRVAAHAPVGARCQTTCRMKRRPMPLKRTPVRPVAAPSSRWAKTSPSSSSTSRPRSR